MNKVIIAHQGAREHYALAAAAHKASMLARLITDFWNPLGERSVELAGRFRVPIIDRLAQRRAPAIPSAKVVALYAQGVAGWYRHRSRKSAEAMYSGFEYEGRLFAQRAKRYCDLEHSCFFGYCCAGLEVLQQERRNGVRTIIDQMDTKEFNEDIRMEEESRNRALSFMRDGRIPETYFERLRQEWAEASCVLVNSEWSQQALMNQGVPLEKITVVPLMYQPPARTKRPTRCNGTLRVLWLGRLSLLKGLAYALEAARELRGSGIDFTFVGPLEVAADQLRLSVNARYVGDVARNKVTDLYQINDVFLFPTLSDGFGMVQLEAMSHGLPVIATVRCGSVVQHGVSGLLVPPADTRSIVEALLMLKSDPDQLEAFSDGALARSRDFAPERIWPQYQRVIEGPSARGDEGAR